MNQTSWNYFDAKYVLTTPNSKRVNELIANFSAVGLDDPEIVEFEPSNEYKKSKKNDSTGSGGVKSQSLMSAAKHRVCDETCRNIANNMFELAKKAIMQVIKHNYI